MLAMPGVDVIEIDDVVPKLYQDQIEAETTSLRMPWFFRLEPGRSGALGPAKSADAGYSGFSNTVFHVDDPGVAPSPMTALLLPLLFTFCDKAQRPYNRLLRIRLGLYPRTMVEADYHHPHVDFYQPHHNALYYVNDADGDSIIFNETFEDVSQALLPAYTAERKFTVAKRIAPKKGKMIGFDGARYHASMHPMQASHRIVIAFSFL
jgi:hypothetical protein